jgi:uncharacterized protein (TIGR02757 family)
VVKDASISKTARENLDRLYREYNRNDLIHPDPLEFLHEYEDLGDREIVGLIASALAYGRVAQILKSIAHVLHRMGRSPRDFVLEATGERLQNSFADFKHRFSTGQELVSLLFGAKQLIRRYGSLNNSFTAHLHADDTTVLPALCAFAGELRRFPNGRLNTLIPMPSKGSACKRLNLFLRWMVRKDEVDPGGWKNVPASKLIVPIDTHMHRIGLALGLTKRRQANLRAAFEITSAFKAIAPDDPLRYDFALTRLGIRKDGDLNAFIHLCTTV